MVEGELRALEQQTRRGGEKSGGDVGVGDGNSAQLSSANWK